MYIDGSVVHSGQMVNAQINMMKDTPDHTILCHTKQYHVVMDTATGLVRYVVY